jgi:hypothetical protein
MSEEGTNVNLKDVHKFVDEYEVELVARCCRYGHVTLYTSQRHVIVKHRIVSESGTLRHVNGQQCEAPYSIRMWHGIAS